MTLLEVEDLSVEYETEGTALRAVNGVSFVVDENERMGIVGESGCGKTTIAKALLRLLPDNGRIVSGEIRHEGRDLATMSNRELRDIRWDEISIVTQSAMNALDPVYTVGDQITEAIHLHEDISKQRAKERAKNLIQQVGLDEERIDSYPHQLSGGMRQRVMIAMSMALEPSLILADEPTTALDVITQDHILARIDETTDQLQSSLLMITHDISVVAETCNKVGVMYAGELVEVGPIDQVFTDPEHPYTQGLLNAYPKIEGESSDLVTIVGEPPDLADPPRGCRFAARCPYAEAECERETPPLTERDLPSHKAACFVTDRGDDISDIDAALEGSEKWLRL
jgi:oligopeptide/dipeptide ABC transporter ATP-binding protein